MRAGWVQETRVSFAMHHTGIESKTKPEAASSRSLRITRRGSRRPPLVLNSCTSQTLRSWVWPNTSKLPWQNRGLRTEISGHRVNSSPRSPTTQKRATASGMRRDPNGLHWMTASHISSPASFASNPKGRTPGSGIRARCCIARALSTASTRSSGVPTSLYVLTCFKSTTLPSLSARNAACPTRPNCTSRRWHSSHWRRHGSCRPNERTTCGCPSWHVPMNNVSVCALYVMLSTTSSPGAHRNTSRGSSWPPRTSNTRTFILSVRKSFSAEPPAVTP